MLTGHRVLSDAFQALEYARVTVPLTLLSSRPESPHRDAIISACTVHS